MRHVTLNRPDKLNAMNMEMSRMFCAALEEADRDDSVRAVLLTGAGRGFCAGADTGEFKDLNPDNAHLVNERAHLTTRVHSLPRQIGKPVIAAVQGVAMGGGAGLALAADILVVSDDLRFGYPELKHGLVPALVMSSLVRHIHPKLAFELVATGRILSGQELLSLGIANRAESGDAVVDTAMELALRCAERPRAAMRESKALMHLTADLGFEEAMQQGLAANIRMRGFSKDE